LELKSLNYRPIFVAAIPSIDGRVHHANHESSLPDLVARTPFVDKNGRFYVGSRQSSIAAFDKRTGEIIRIMSSIDDHKGDLLQAFTEMHDHDQIVYLGRVDYGVSVYDVSSGEAEVNFSNSFIMSISDMLKDDISPEKSPAFTKTSQHDSISTFDKIITSISEPDSIEKPAHMKKSGDRTSPFLISTPDGNVGLFNTNRGSMDWISENKFASPVAFGMSTSGDSMRVHMLSNSLKSLSPEHVKEEMFQQLEKYANQKKRLETSSIIRTLDSGNLYALPVGPISPVKAWSNPKPDSSRPPFYKKSLMLLDPIVHAYHGSNLLPQPNAVDPPEDVEDVIYLDPTNLYKNLQPSKSQQQKWYHILLKVLTSWIPPAVALAFVISFEIGRRERLKAENIKITYGKGALDETTSSREDNDYGNSSKKDSLVNNITTEGNFGAIKVSDDILGYGGHGTVVYRGTLASRSVAVKRMLQTYHASADREISLLISSDGHPNVVRYFLKEARGDFVYLALELCDMSLHDLIVGLRGKLDSDNHMNKKIRWEKGMKSMLKQISEGVRHLHGLRIVHRDLKPQNILLKRKGYNHVKCQNIVQAFENEKFVPKISDMGLGKQLVGQSSFGMSTLGNGSLMRGGGSIGGGGQGHSASEKVVGPGSVGWQAPEVMSMRLFAPSSEEKNDSSLIAESSPHLSMSSHRTSRSVDIFSLGCVFHSTLLDGAHPFGEWYEREANIMKNKPDTSVLKDVWVEAEDLIKSMLSREPRLRPTATNVCEHCFFWNISKRLAFISEFSDRIEAEILLPPVSTSFNVLYLERNAASVVGLSWDQQLDPDLILNTSKFRTYDPSSVRDCLRLIRNKCHHYDELPIEVKNRIGPSSEGLMAYFDDKFPKLLSHCYNVCRENMIDTDIFVKKFKIPIRKKETIVRSQICKDESDVEPSDDLSKPLDEATLVSKEREVNENLTEAEVSREITEDEDTSTSTDQILESELVHSTKQSISPEAVNMSSVIIWENSDNAKTLHCRGWMRSTSFWIHEPSSLITKRNPNIMRCADDPKFRTRLCNHWDVSLGTHCPMRRKNKCVFAHGPVELRVKEGKRNR